jgi:hypothetical protein
MFLKQRLDLSARQPRDALVIFELGGKGMGHEKPRKKPRALICTIHGNDTF